MDLLIDEYFNEFSLQRVTVPDEHNIRKRQKHLMEESDRAPKYNTLADINQGSTATAFCNL